MWKFLLVLLLLTGCSEMITALNIGSVPESQWAIVKQSVFNKPCQLKHSQSECPIYVGDGSCQIIYHQKNASFYGANTIVDDSGTIDYFYCASGIPLFNKQYRNAWLIRHDKSVPNASIEDFNHVVEQCNYESHKATINTSPSTPRRAFIPTGSYALNQYQLDNIHNAESQKLYDEIHLEYERLDLGQQCVKVKGFTVTKTSSKTDFDDLKKYCSDIDNLIVPCFIP